MKPVIELIIASKNKIKTRLVRRQFPTRHATRIGRNSVLVIRRTNYARICILVGTSEVGIYKSKQEIKKTRKHAFDQESDHLTHPCYGF